MTIPTLLTLVRLISSVVILPFLVFFLVPLGDFAAGKFLAILCTLLALTDFFDGYLARKYKQETLLGKLLDPLADKCFVIGAIVPLIALQRIYFYFGFIIIARELIITGLRYIAHQHGFILRVTRFGKWKATFQYLYIIFVVGTPWAIDQVVSLRVEKGLLGGMIIFTVLSGIMYCQNFVKQWRATTVQN
jgi:CDP-diacylglycerol--glycerol-3-phosphate 3-phosphatidyltransferase